MNLQGKLAKVERGAKHQEHPDDFPHLCTSPSITQAFSICHFVHLSVFLDLLLWKQTQERALLVQGEESSKRPERPTERTLPQRENEEIAPKVSIPIPEEHKALKKCRLYSSAFPSPRIPFMMSFLLVLALAVWWLIFLWLENRVLKTKTTQLCLWLQMCNYLRHASDPERHCHRDLRRPFFLSVIKCESLESLHCEEKGVAMDWPTSTPAPKSTR